MGLDCGVGGYALRWGINEGGSLEEINMAERHTIISEARGEPLPTGRVGARLYVPLSGSPSGRWSRDLSARLTTELAGRSAVGHLRLNDLVQGDHIVLEGVEEGEASNLADALQRAVDATNSACEDRAEQPNENMPRDTADAIAQRIGVNAPPDVPPSS
jgi:hypothetical protein